MSTTTRERRAGAAGPTGSAALRTPDRRTPTRRSRAARTTAMALLMLAPALLALFFLRVLPMITAVGQSFQSTSLATGTTSFAGIENYAYLFTDPGFHAVLGVTLLFNLVLNPAIVVLSAALALLTVQNVPLVGLWRSLIFVPAAVPGAVVALIWSTALQPDGLVNSILETIGLPPQPFLTSANQAAFSIGIMVTWGAIGYWMIFIIAGLKDIPESLYEAAALDGAGWWRRLFAITLPLLKRPMSFVLIACTVGSFLVFAPVQVLTKGGPNGATNFIMYDIYNRAYLLNDLGVGQAEVVVLMLLLSIIVAIQFRLLREEKS
ncbi:carbohydrate ABC transporter permease [Microbacterium saperdae]|uniref:Carbohydrate ABC transporter membrane protein 1 (CUT1 family) n=1 Tax=Microbacterium saperdae TaxID=69368 RepID=A0A543BBA3_9MICO|nr:sugar ABC transporter permease [Microbacterium saperdae]TQL82107.1 carbohydrate ABC transporter membrane protein 1 (CUT1 family) [Microbacterium saperdae]GGM37249.1 sugar ABC transporter permease [Microbacterium saperdae]